MTKNSCAFTGHRPTRFAFGYDESNEQCLKIKELMRKQIAALIAGDVTEFYTGMALGVDQWAASIVLNMKDSHPGIRLVAVLPCETQANSWSVEQRERYFDTLALCDEVVTLNKHYTRACMFERNRHLVDHAEYLLAVYDGSGKGGTAYTIRYGEQQRRRVTIIHPDTLAVTNPMERGGGYKS